MRALQAISTFLLLIGVGFFLFNLIFQFAVHGGGNIKILSIEGLWKDIDKSSYETVKSMAETAFPSTQVAFFVHLPAAVVLLAISAIFYIPVRIMSLLGVGKKQKAWNEK